MFGYPSFVYSRLHNSSTWSLLTSSRKSSGAYQCVLVSLPISLLTAISPAHLLCYLLGGRDATAPSQIINRLIKDTKNATQLQDLNVLLPFLSPPVQLAQWAHMRHFASVCLSVCLSVRLWQKFRLELNSYL